MTITWQIVQLDCRPTDNFVHTAHWRASAMDDNHAVSTYATSNWFNGTPVVPYLNLTEETVLDWVWKNNVDKAAIEADLMVQLEAKKNKKSTLINAKPANFSLPWGNENLSGGLFKTLR
jgi:hypothetical protein